MASRSLVRTQRTARHFTPMPSFEQLVVQAALDVAIERLTRLHPGRQFFIFGAKGDPFFAHFEPSQAELELLNRALSVLEKSETRPAPFVVRGASGQFTAMVLDAERSLFAVVLWIPAKRKPGEARVERVQGSVQAPTWRD